MRPQGDDAVAYTYTQGGVMEPQGVALGVCTCHSIVALKGQKSLAQGNTLWFQGNDIKIWKSRFPY